MKRKNETSYSVTRARYNLLFTILLSVFNVYFVLSQGVIKIPFSSSFSTYSAVFSKAIANQNGDESFCRVGILLAGVFLGIYFVCYLSSKKNSLFLMVAFVLFIFDTVFLILVCIILSQLNILTVFDILLHVLTLYMLYTGVVASRKTHKNTDKDNDVIKASDIYEDVTQLYENEGNEPIISASINGLDIAIYIDENRATMVVNNYVCAQKIFDIDTYFELYAVINDVELSFISRKGKEYLLFADKELLNSVYITKA